MSANSGRQEKGEKERSKEYIKLKSKQRKLNLKWQAWRYVGPALCFAALTFLFHRVPRSWPSPTCPQGSRGNPCACCVAVSSFSSAELAKLRLLHVNKGFVRKAGEVQNLCFPHQQGSLCLGSAGSSQHVGMQSAAGPWCGGDGNP